MTSRDDRRANGFRRRLLTGVLVLGIGAAVVMMAAGSDLSVAGAAADQQAAAAVASRWFGIPVGTAMWLGLGAIALLLGLLSSFGSRGLTATPARLVETPEPSLAVRPRLVATGAELSVAS